MNAVYGIAAGEIGREEIVEGIHGDDCVAYVAENLAQPVSPSDEEPNERTEPLSAIHVDPRFEIRSDVGKDAKGIARKNIPIPVTTQAMITAPTEAWAAIFWGRL